MPDGELQRTWEAAAFDREKGEWVHTTLHSYDNTTPEEIPDFINQAAPTRINPTRRQRPEADAETLVFFGDTHHPFQDRRKIALANLAVRELMPRVVTYVGDDLDNANWSRFESRAEWRDSTQRGIDEFSAQLAQTRADIGADGEIVVHEGNHNIRFARELRQYNAEIIGIKRANAEEELGVLTMEFLLRCDEIGVQYISGYPEAEYWHSDTLRSFHGHRTASGNLVTVKELKDATVNQVHGHTHQAGIAYRTFRNGKEDTTIWGMEVGTFADPEQIPSGKFSTTENGNVLRQLHDWQYGLGVVHRTEDGLEIPQFIPITDDGILLEGKWYKS